MNQQYIEEKKKKSSFLIISTTIFLCIIVIGGGLYLYYSHLISSVNINGKEKIVEIPQGYSLKNIGTLLEKENIIKNSFSFEIFTRLEKKQNALKSGSYLLSPSMNVEEIIEKISNGQVINDNIKVTIPEGFELSMIAERLEEKNLVSREDFLNAAQNIADFDYTFLEEIPKDRKNPLEGYLFPDTYEFSKDATGIQIIEKMLQRFDKAFKEEYYARAKELNMSIDEVVILASVVEREARVSSDRPIIAGVFYNRLKKNMKLESCATVQYVLGERKPRLLYSDLEVESQYNTYKHVGLPIGPIASFGEDSLKATLYPEETEYLFFVAKNDGSHVFSQTLNEHNIAKKRVLK